MKYLIHAKLTNGQSGWFRTNTKSNLALKYKPVTVTRFEPQVGYLLKFDGKVETVLERYKINS